MSKKEYLEYQIYIKTKQQQKTKKDILQNLYKETHKNKSV